MIELAHWSQLLQQEYEKDAPFDETTPLTSSFMHALVMLAQPSRIVEFGCHVGFTTAWLGAACRKLGRGHVYAYEIDHDTIEKARANMQHVLGDDWAQWITLVEEDALKVYEHGVDFLFLDLNPKALYIPALCHTRFNPGAIVCAHDVVWDSSALGEYVAFMRQRPDWQTLTLPYERGLMIARFNP